MEKLNKLRSVESTSGANVENLSVEHVEETFWRTSLVPADAGPVRISVLPLSVNLIQEVGGVWKRSFLWSASFKLCWHSVNAEKLLSVNWVRLCDQRWLTYSFRFCEEERASTNKGVANPSSEAFKTKRLKRKGARLLTLFLILRAAVSRLITVTSLQTFNWCSYLQVVSVKIFQKQEQGFLISERI